MSTITDEQLPRILSRLKERTVIVQRKRNGENCARQWFVDEDEYILHRVAVDGSMAKSRRCK
jgi:hypothetical protein